MSSDLYRGTVLTDLIDKVEELIPVELSPEERRAHPPDSRHWARCDFSYCKKLLADWRKYDAAESSACDQSRVPDPSRIDGGDPLPSRSMGITTQVRKVVCPTCFHPLVMDKCWNCDVEARRA